MMKVLIAAILTVIVSSMPAHAEPIMAIGSALISAAGGAAAIGKVLLGIAFNVACSRGVRMTRKPGGTHDGD